MKQMLPVIAERLMRCPAAPYHEGLVASEVLRICEENKLRCEVDRFGNILVRCARKLNKAPIALAAHMDHPGFVLRKRIGSRTFVARFLGGVGDAYFKAKTPVLLMPGRIPARLGKRVGTKHRDFELHAERDVRYDPKFAVWKLPDFQLRKGLLRGRVCDDLIGVATILSVLIRLKGTKAAANVLGIISRAEEVGFQGALALAKTGRVPRESLVISLETSRELLPVKIGQGVIIRVGDKASIFDSDGTRFLAEVAGDLRQGETEFVFQRALMSGGTCEATAYQEYGYRSAAVCVALGNYHNCGAKERIRAEFVSEADALSMERLLIESARQWPRYRRLVSRLTKRLECLAREGQRQLENEPIFRKNGPKARR